MEEILRLPDEPDRMEDIVVSSEETVSTSQGNASITFNVLFLALSL